MLKRKPKTKAAVVGAAGPADEDTIVSVLSQHVKERPNHQIFRWVDKKARVTSTMTYKQLWDQSMAVQKLLQSRGVKRGDRVMIAYPFGLEFLAGLVGCMMAGVVGCSVYPPNPQRLQADLPAFHQKVEDAEAIFALTTSSLRRFMILNHFIGNRSSVSKRVCS
jgi:acyl-CoA synthetase (AMP-forming)/AMP-acid ligase II